MRWAGRTALLGLVLAAFVAWGVLWRSPAVETGGAAQAPESAGVAGVERPAGGELSPPAARELEREVGEAEVAERVAVAERWTLRGHVVGWKREPVEVFGVRAVRRAPSGEVLELRELPLSTHADGKFELTELEPGAWEITPFAPGRELVMSRRFWEPSEPSWVYQLLDEREETVAGRHIDTPSRIRGHVVDPSGAPFEGAVVLAAITSDTGQPQWRESALTSSDGGFALEMPEGSCALVARAQQYVASEPLEFEVSAGRPVAGLLLRLAPPTMVRVIVQPLRADEPRSVRIEWTDLDSRASDRQDALEGRVAELAVTSFGDVEWSFSTAQGDPARLMLSVQRDVPAQFEIGPAAARPVRLTGTIEAPAVRLRYQRVVACVADPSMGLWPSVSGALVDGHFALELPVPGRWRLRAQTGADIGWHVAGPSIDVEVPAARDFHFDWRP